MSSLNVVITDYSNVFLSKDSLKYLKSIDNNWSDIFLKRTQKNKHEKHVTKKINEFVVMVNLFSEIKWLNGQELTEF